MFSQLKGPRTEIVVAESILPWWLRKIPLVENGWINFQGALVRNWILQQIVKLSAAGALQEDVLAFLDADVAFVRGFDISSFVRDGRVRLFRVAGGHPLPPAAGKAYDDLDEGTSHALALPLARPMNDAELRDFYAEIGPGQAAVMLSSKAGMPVTRYRHLVERFH
jgi:hypothetical protein